MAAAVLLGAADVDGAAAAAGRVPDLAGAPCEELRRWDRWLYGLYPGTGGRLGSVQSDLLAEHHAVTQLAGDPGLARAVLSGVDARQADQALTVLGRAWGLHEQAGPVIEAGLRANLAGLATAAIDMAIQTQAKMGALLASVLRSAPATLQDLIRIKEAMLYPSVVLAAADLAVTHQIRRELPPHHQAANRQMGRRARYRAVSGRPAGRRAASHAGSGRHLAGAGGSNA